MVVFDLDLPTSNAKVKRWGGLIASSAALALAEAMQSYDNLVLVLVPDTITAVRLAYELKAFLPKALHHKVLNFPDWETLPYDHFSPHQDIISERLTILYKLANNNSGILLVPIATALQRLSPVEYLLQNTLIFKEKEQINLILLRQQLELAGYRLVTQVREHGEFAVRGSIIDLFPMGAACPYRLDLLADEIDSIRSFNPETQLSITKIANIKLLPAKEYPTDSEAISTFARQWELEFTGAVANYPWYQDLKSGIKVAGLEYYLPLFFPKVASLFTYLPANCLIARYGEFTKTAENFWQELTNRYEQYRHDITRPILPPKKLFLPVDELFHEINKFRQIYVQQELLAAGAGKVNFPVAKLPEVQLESVTELALEKIKNLLITTKTRILLGVESPGRKVILQELLLKYKMTPTAVDSWQEFLATTQQLAIAVMPLDTGIYLTKLNIMLITEADLFGNKVMQRRRRAAKAVTAENMLHNLGELELGTLVVHIEHGIGRYIGLQTIAHGGQEGEFVVIEYAGNDKLYVPVTALHLISRYSGVELSKIALHALGGNKWQKAKNKALEQIRDVAVELLAIYAKREMRTGIACQKPDAQYATFAAKFPFEETPDQEQAIAQVIQDLIASKPMDRVICGDVGFGKTEVAMRASFLVVNSNMQVAILVPTTLLAQQHYQTFIDRFADFPVRIEVMSRFNSNQKQAAIALAVAAGNCDIVIGTHKLLQENISFHNLGLIVIDEEHRFGVRQKERFKALRSEVNILAMTATPIPRTLNMALAKLRDLSIIATPPAKRLAIKTFVSEYSKPLIQEAILRELHRGGQIYYLHNNVDTIEKTALELQALITTAKIAVAHGQMPERELEKIMFDFYHRRYNILLCTTIIETGIDIPSANTIIIERADKLGLAQLYQLRGRVGRSHHQAYAFCLTPPAALMKAEAIKRLEALSSLETLGSGFTLATHDLEIRGAGELLGEEQSGNMQALGFSLYMELLEQAVNTLQSGKEVDININLANNIELDLLLPAIIPTTYVEDVHLRLVQYKRIAMAKDLGELTALQVEMIDRFGILPMQTKNLFMLAALRIYCLELGICKIKLGLASSFIEFTVKPKIDPKVIVVLLQDKAMACKLHGSHGLKFHQQLATPEARIAFISQLFKILSNNKIII